MKVCILGLGYIGLPTAAMLADAGYDVVGFDVSAEVLSSLRNGCGTIAELDVRSLAVAMIRAGRLTISDQVTEADVFIICVPTPNLADHRPDLSYVNRAMELVLDVAQPGNLVVLESTVPPGTVERIIVRALEARGLADRVLVAHCPERVIPGAIIHELKHNSRVIGGYTPEAAEAARDLYKSFVDGKLFLTDCKTAEMVKVMENTYRDVNVALANEFAIIAEDLDINVWDAIRIANHHPRVEILSPGPGVGGHCIPIDPHFLIEAAPFLTDVIQAARRVNDRMPKVVVRRIQELVPSPPYGRKIAILGASYKGNVDDTRESPSEKVIELLREYSYDVTVYDPVAGRFAHPLAATLEEATAGADAVVLMVDHTLFKSIDPATVGQTMRGKVLIDTRNFFDAAQWQHEGFQIYTLGAKALKHAPAPLSTLTTTE